MQSRLDKVKDISATSEIQLAEIRAAIIAERTARPESVRSFILFASSHSLLSRIGRSRTGFGETYRSQE